MNRCGNAFIVHVLLEGKHNGEEVSFTITHGLCEGAVCCPEVYIIPSDPSAYSFPLHLDHVCSSLKCRSNLLPPLNGKEISNGVGQHFVLVIGIEHKAIQISERDVASRVTHSKGTLWKQVI